MRGLFFLLTFVEICGIYIGNGSYNSFRNQVGFCKLQGFDTVSRLSTSNPFLEKTNVIGVGMNHKQFQHNISNCGRCLWIESIENFPVWNDQLTVWNDSLHHNGGFLAIVLDECYDPICETGFLDFDIYSETQPVKRGNPYNIHWYFVDCPTQINEIELLFCFSNTCHESDPIHRTVDEVLQNADPYFWSVFVRNSPLPILSISVADIALKQKEGWFYDNGTPFDYNSGFTLVISSSQWTLSSTIHLSKGETNDAFRGGILLAYSSDLNMVVTTSNHFFF